MSRKGLKRAAILAAVLAVVGGCTWLVLRNLDPTSSAVFVSDSPDGRYRCAVFCDDGLLGGHPEYEAGLFEGGWPHRELSGQRVEWNYDSVNSSDFQAVWRDDGVDIDFCTGYGNNRATFSGQDADGRQEWKGP